jgi:Flp pilus assembly protein TadB
MIDFSVIAEFLIRLVTALVVFAVGVLFTRWIVDFTRKRLNQRNVDRTAR